MELGEWLKDGLLLKLRNLLECFRSSTFSFFVWRGGGFQLRQDGCLVTKEIST